MPDVRRVVSFGVQQCLTPDDWKPMATVGIGVYEIRGHTEVEHRVFYVAKFAEGVYVLYAFEKRTRQTRRADIALARSAWPMWSRHDGGKPL